MMKAMHVTIILAFVVLVAGSHTNADVVAKGQRRIHQALVGHTATDLHFKTYQADRDSAWINDWSIGLSEPFGNISEVPGSWPFNDGRTHSVTVDVTGLSVPYCTWVNIDVKFKMNEYNSVKFADIAWTYDDHDPVDPFGANIGWKLPANPGISAGGWVIGKYAIKDMSNNLLGYDLVGHEYTSSEMPSLENFRVCNGTPDDPGSQSVIISGVSLAKVDTELSFGEIWSFTDWDQSFDDFVLGPGECLPEPASISFLLFGGMALLCRRKVTS